MRGSRLVLPTNHMNSQLAVDKTYYSPPATATATTIHADPINHKRESGRQAHFVAVLVGAATVVLMYACCSVHDCINLGWRILSGRITPTLT
jgi:hypothetical protein